MPYKKINIKERIHILSGFVHLSGPKGSITGNLDQDVNLQDEYVGIELFSNAID